MSSDHPFDDQLKQSFDGFEPNVHANWAEFERSLDAPQAAEATSSTGRGMNRWAVAAAVAAGGALMWVAKPVVERAFVAEQEVVDTVGTEDGQSFDEAWAEFTSVTEGFVEDVLDAEAEVELVEASLAAENASEAPSKSIPVRVSNGVGCAPRAARALQQHNGVGRCRKRSRAHGAFARRIAI